MVRDRDPLLRSPAIYRPPQEGLPSRLLVQSTLPDADRLITERAAAEEKKRRADIVARRRQRVADIRSGKNIPPFPAPYQAAFEALRAERIALEKKKAVEGQLESLGRTMRTRASDAKLQKNEEAENALGEVMQQLDAEDKEGEPSDSGDSDYEDEGAGAARPAKISKGIVLRGNADEDSVASEDVDGSVEDAETEAGSSSGKDAEEMEVSSSNEESASGVAQKRNRKGHRKSPRKAARTATTLSPRDGSDAEDGAFVEGFPCRWPSWEDFHRAFEEFQGETYQQFSSRTSTSVSSRNNQMRNAVAREAKRTGEDAAVVETRKGTQYIPESWVKYCKTLRCTHGRTQAARGSGKRKHRLVRTTECTAKINARVV
ncbi:hypothetical protein PRNP1_015263 [Phytophthora ramorum]